MLATLAVCAALLTPAEASTQPARRPLPKDWPPLPDFKRTIDYVQWWQDHLNAGITDDAAPLWAELAESPDDPPELKKAKAEMWGENEEGQIPGLFTGEEKPPERYAWDPKDHPEWEEAYQAQRAHGLHERLVQASKRRHLSVKTTWGVPKPSPSSSEADRPEPDFGFTPENRLLLTSLLPSLAVQRAAFRVLLQDAWRAQDGKVDSDAMVDGIQAAVGVGAQLGCNARSLMELLVAAAIRETSYDTLFRALDEDLLDAKRIAEIDRWVARYDQHACTWLDTQPSEIAGLAELLQFAYAPEDGTWPVSPRPNRQNVAKLVKYVTADREAFPELTPVPLDIAGQISQCDPRVAVQQLVDLHLAVREIVERKIPLETCPRIGQLYQQFRDNAANHVILRQFVHHSGPGQAVFLIEKAEACRRATRLVVALHRVHQETGKWPESLRDRRLRVQRTTLTDPFSRKDFIYRVEDAKPLLYSVGYNGKDDGGKHGEWRDHFSYENDKHLAKDVDYVFWPVQRDKQ